MLNTSMDIIVFLSVQAVYRAAKAALKLKRYGKVIELCKAGLAIDPASTELARMQDVS